MHQHTDDAQENTYSVYLEQEKYRTGNPRYAVSEAHVITDEPRRKNKEHFERGSTGICEENNRSDFQHPGLTERQRHGQVKKQRQRNDGGRVKNCDFKVRNDAPAQCIKVRNLDDVLDGKREQEK
ncbi:MAG: hypothetical protein AAB294_04180 [Pseudomonadota bacterium]